MTTLIIDNYDSFTWNLHQLVGALDGSPLVVRNDAIDLAGIRALNPARIILSPGPGRPDDPRRVGVMPAVIRELDVPILGVCLGHQCIVHTFGGTVVRGDPVHGKTGLITHAGDALFANLPNPFEAMRYHSLRAAVVPEVLRVTAWIPGPREWGRESGAKHPSKARALLRGGGVGGEAPDVEREARNDDESPCKDQTVMAVRHETRPIFGVQFHPESVGTPYGAELCRAFLRGDFS